MMNVHLRLYYITHQSSKRNAFALGGFSSVFLSLYSILVLVSLAPRSLVVCATTITFNLIRIIIDWQHSFSIVRSFRNLLLISFKKKVCAVAVIVWPSAQRNVDENDGGKKPKVAKERKKRRETS